MASPRCPAIRNILQDCSSRFRPPQRRWARVHDIRLLATHSQQDRLLQKYKEKLEEKAKQEGHKSINSLKEAYKDKIRNLRRHAPTIPTSTTPSPSNAFASNPRGTFPFPPPPPAPLPVQEARKTTASSSATPGIKPLSSYLDIPKLADLPPKEIELIWRLRNAKDPHSLCATISLDTYRRIQRTARTHPQFILPLPRPTAEDGSAEQSPNGFESSPAGRGTAADIHFLQWMFYPAANGDVQSHTSTVMFTHLAAYKLHGSYAQPHTTITHHLDLADSKGLVLLQGSVIDGRGVSVEEGRWLVMCLQKFYDFEGHGGGIGKEKRTKLLESFTKGDAEGFKVEELVEEAERVS